MDLNTIEAAERHLFILRALADQNDYRASETVLQQGLAMIGQDLPQDELRESFVWLAQQGLVAHADLAGLWVLTATQMGVDTAAGRKRVEGVARPKPGI
ncbi:VpaChn25_0724 family phage protein [Magnetococcus sp. PR-3]|uniref:VpaChn25_0724 family phage protein n=1 Tax=Magnetococcus sp. PR-3 TaxID=3120355 RepID=UPI002FCDF67F